MTVTALTLVSGIQLPASAINLFQATNPTQITSAAFTNTSGSSVAITVYLVRSGGVAGPANIITPPGASGLIAAGTALVPPELRGKNLAAGDSIWAFAATANEVNVCIDGFTVST